MLHTRQSIRSSRCGKPYRPSIMDSIPSSGLPSEGLRCFDEPFTRLCDLSGIYFALFGGECAARIQSASSHHRGLKTSHFYWVRRTIALHFMAFTALEQYRLLIPALPSSRRQILAMVLVMACGSALSEYLLALWIGYPIPFVGLTGAPPYLFFMVCCIHVAWGKFLKQHPDAMLELKSYQNAISVVFILTSTYPAYNYLFEKLSPTQKTWFTLLLPVIKLIAKNAISPFSKYIEDFRPDVVIFNVESFHAFFVALCMQGSTSVRTVFLLLLMDFLHASISCGTILIW